MTRKLVIAVALPVVILSSALIALRVDHSTGTPASSFQPPNDTLPLACHLSSAIGQCAASDSPIGPLVGLANRLPLGLKDCRSPEAEAQSSWKAEALPTLDRFRASTVIAQLSGAEQIIAQNSALHIAVCSDGETRKEYASLVRALASDGAHAEPSVEASREVRNLFGALLVLRSADVVPMVHDRSFSFTRFFLPFDGENVRLDVGYLVSVDSHWMPHLTDIVGSVEARTPIEGPALDACVRSLEPSAYSCNAPTTAHLVPLETGLAPGGNVFWLAGKHGGASCLRCHDDGPNGTSTLEPSKASKEFEDRRRRFLDAAAKSLAQLCKDADLC